MAEVKLWIKSFYKHNQFDAFMQFMPFSIDIINIILNIISTHIFKRL